MSLELLFGLAALLFLTAWGLWLFAITRGSRIGMIAGPVALIAIGAAVVFINGERSDQQEEDYGNAITAFIDAVATAQEEAYEANGSYTDEEDLAELTDPELTTQDGGLLMDDKDVEGSVSLEEGGNGYTLIATIEDQSYTLVVERTRGGVEETRTCEASEGAGCENGSW